MRLLRIPSQLPFALSLLLAVSSVVIAVLLSAYLQLAACPLCIVQRVLYLIVAIASTLGLYLQQRALIRKLASLLATISSATGTVVAGYQIYLQHNPFAASCGTGDSWWELGVERAGELWPLVFKADGLCSDGDWTFLSVTLAEWSLLAFIVLFLLAAFSLFSLRSRHA